MQDHISKVATYPYRGIRSSAASRILWPCLPYYFHSQRRFLRLLNHFLDFSSFLCILPCSLRDQTLLCSKSYLGNVSGFGGAVYRLQPRKVSSLRLSISTPHILSSILRTLSFWYWCILILFYIANSIEATLICILSLRATRRIHWVDPIGLHNIQRQSCPGIHTPHYIRRSCWVL